MNAIFQNVKKGNPMSSTFDLSHEKKLSLDMGKLVPVLVQEVLPGDRFNINSETMIRFSPLVSPVMHRIHAHLHYFHVPNRILFENPRDWEDWITEHGNATLPTLDLQGESIEIGSLADYLGLPIVEAPTTFAYELNINLLPVLAYMKIYNDFYRNPRIQAELDLFNPTIVAGVLFDEPINRNWEDDYFTSAMPYAQYGNSSTADVLLDPYSATRIRRTNGTSPGTGGILAALPLEDGTLELNDAANEKIQVEAYQNATVDIKEIRYAEALQRYLEKINRAGNRYKDWLKSFFGVETSDTRLDMAQYLGGSRTPVIISEVLNTTGTEENVQGTMAGHGINVGKSYDAQVTIEEHGWIIGILSVMPEPNYFQNVPKFFERLDPLDYANPEFALLGEQPILNRELFFRNDGTTDDLEFGYAKRYDEYRFNPSSVHGQFRDTLEFWHLGRKFNPAGPPLLGDGFLKTATTDFSRIFAIESLPKYEQLYCQVYHNIQATRPLPYDPTPRI